MRWALLALVAACGEDWTGTFSDGVHAPLIAQTCDGGKYLVFAFDHRSLAAVLADSTATPYLDSQLSHGIWSGSLSLHGDTLEVAIEGNAFTAHRVATIDPAAEDCSSLVIDD